MSIQFKISRFNELSAAELYEVLRLRSEVFVVEQKCVYQDLDGKDAKALHLIGLSDHKIVAYCRLFAPGYYFENASIGRVVIDRNYRDRKWGHSMIHEAIKGLVEAYGETVITISAQKYLLSFYESHGFIQEGAEYLEDGIPHIRMNRP